MKLFALRLATTFALWRVHVGANTARARIPHFAAPHVARGLWQWYTILERCAYMKRRIYYPKFFGSVMVLWLVCTVYMFQNGGIVAGLYFVALGVSPALVFVWLVTHAPKKEGEQ